LTFKLEPTDIAPYPLPVRTVSVSHRSNVTKWLLRLLLFTLVLVGLFLFRAPLLTGLARLWIVDEPLSKADAIVVLGGGLQSRPFVAAELYKQGLAPKVVVMNIEPRNTEELGLTQSETSLLKDVLIKRGVPEESLVFIGNEVSSTYEEALALRDWVETTKARRLIIPTEPFHTRRVNWLFEKMLNKGGTPVEVLVTSTKPVSSVSSNWWQTERGLIEFQNEVVKFVYYVVKVQ
jgi:uncharacterized SAM-binding protein YcdF (DUF218 family)